MRISFWLGSFARIGLGGTLLVGCAAAGAATHPAGSVVPASTSQALPSAVRRTLSSVSCTGSGTASFVGGIGNNVAAGTAAAVLGGFTNLACDDGSTIGGGSQNAIAAGANRSEDAFIGGGDQNTILSGVSSSIVGGLTNELTGSAKYSFIGGGQSNNVSGQEATIVGGVQNQNAGTRTMIGDGENNSVTAASTDGLIVGGNANAVSATYGVVGGGEHNTVSGEGGYIGGGGYNAASGEGAIVDGGFESTAGGNFGTVPGGYLNSAGGTYSFAAGARASAGQAGTFVWSDGSNGNVILASTQAYQYVARASGGVTFWTNPAATVGATLAPGSGTWSSASDRHLKTDVVRLDDAAVLEKVGALPISSWSYTTERGVRHVGPMAQDFYAAFGVGEDDKHIASIDEDGVALAAIKALRAENVTLRAVTSTQSAQLAEQAAQVAALRTSQTQLKNEMAVLRRVVTRASLGKS